MLFTSFEFLIYFLPLVFIFFYVFKNYGLYILIFSSIIFYSSWNFYHLIILVSSVVFNYIFGKIIIKNKRKELLLIAILFNVSILIIFKYTNFIIENYNYLFNENLVLFDLIFPLALSFYTLQQIAFLIDCYEGEIKRINFKIYSIFVIFFPQLISGPIVLYNNVYNYYTNNNLTKINYKNLYFAILFIVCGLSKKILLADTLSSQVNIIYNSAIYSSLDFATSLIVTLFFTYQIYFDFSGYTDLALGIALLFNIKLPVNFNSPYKSFSIIEFWSKWHMTLSNFINNYVFFLSIKKFNINNFLVRNLLIVLIMIFVGFWHGPTWGYIIFGAIHGSAILINYFWREYSSLELNKYFSWFLTFVLINIAFIFFKSSNLSVAYNILIGFTELIDFNIFNDFKTLFKNLSKSSILIFVIGTFVIFLPKNSQEIIKKTKLNLLNIGIISFLLSICLLRLRGAEFIYFAF